MPENVEYQIGDEVVDEGGQNGVGIITKVTASSVEADWCSHRFEGIRRGAIGKHWIRRTRTAAEIAAAQKRLGS